jgi:hypothetical protein
LGKMTSSSSTMKDARRKLQPTALPTASMYISMATRFSEYDQRIPFNLKNAHRPATEATETPTTIQNDQ